MSVMSVWVSDSPFNRVPLQLISGFLYKKKIIIIKNSEHSIQPNSICPAKSHDQLECPFPSLPSRMPKNGVWTFLSAPAPALKWTIVPASVILQQFISSCRQTLSFLLAPSTFFVSKTTADQQQYNKIKLYLLGRFEGRGKKGVEKSKSPHPPSATKTPKGRVLKPQLTCSAPSLVSLLQGTSNLPGGL